MKRFQLVVREHQEHGGYGIVIENSGRDYFEPAPEGAVIAHDILEHPVRPHSCGFTDELMALGGILAGRIKHGWARPDGYRGISYEDLESDIHHLAVASVYENNVFAVLPCNSRLRDSDLMVEIRASVRNGLIEAVSELEDNDCSDLPAEYAFDIDSITGHIARGHQLFKKRFPDTYSAVYLFDKISKTCERWLKGAEEWQTAELLVDFGQLDARLIETWEDY